MLYPKKTIVKKYEKNPILKPQDLPWECSGIYNCGVIKRRKDNKYIMMCRIESIDISNHFVVAYSDDGYNFKINKEPIRLPEDSEFKEYTKEMIYDPRITYVEEDDTYYIFFACHSSYGVRIGQLKTKDFENFEWIGFGSEIDNRNAVLFPEKINGLYVRLDRPLAQNDQGDIWISSSPDLVFWGNSKCVMRRGTHGGWTWKKIGAGSPPIKTKYGWLLCWHGVHMMSGYKYVYHSSVMLLDLKDPSKIVACAKAPLLSPTEWYELEGLNSHVCFATAMIPEDNGEVKIYYGAADTYECLAIAKLDDLIWACYER